MFDQIDTIKNLSRFFFASNTDELMQASLALAVGKNFPAVPDWASVEFSFNHLFVGPRALLAPPYASIYLGGGETRLMGDSTDEIRHLYEMMGLVSPWLNKIPDDHISLELDALWQIEVALLAVDSEQLKEVREFLLAHLQAWIPKFRARVYDVEDVHPVVLFVMERLSSVMQEYEMAAANGAVEN